MTSETPDPEAQNKDAEPSTETEEQGVSTEKPDAASSENLNPEQRKAYLDNEVDDGEEAEDSPQALRDQLLRVMADNENLRKRTERDILAAKNMARWAWRVICSALSIIWKPRFPICLKTGMIWMKR